MRTFEQEARFCLHCGAALQQRPVAGRMRPSCPACGWTYFPDPKVAAATLVLQEGQVLLVQRKYPPFTGLWALPAGFVDAQEDPARAAERECAEETGLRVQVVDLLDVIAGRSHPRGADLVLVYLAKRLGGRLQAADDARDAGWFALTDLPPLAFPATHRVLQRFQAG